jgi:hypothetical protein
MTTGRINQVTTFRSAFADITTRVRQALTFTMWSSSTLSVCQDPPQLNGPLFPKGVGASNPQMASPRFPFSHVPSEIPSSRTGTKVTHLQWGLPTSDDTLKVHVQTWRIPKWLAASGLTIGKQSTSPPTLLKHVTQGQLEASKAFVEQNKKGWSPSS